MRVFISWSGKLSREVAEILRKYLPLMLQGLEVFMSQHDMESGGRWSTQLAAQLEASNFGIICLTPQNLQSAWLLFEAGALTKHAEGRACGLLLGDLKPADVESPLSQFQNRRFIKTDFRTLVRDINTKLPTPLTSEQVELIFEKWWPDLEAAYQAALKNVTAPMPMGRPRDHTDVLQEILLTVRNIAQFVGHPDTMNDGFLSKPVNDGTLREYTPDIFRDTLVIAAGVGELIMEWKKKNDRDLDQDTKWEEAWTQALEQEGELFVVMKGIQGMTLPQGYYDEQVKPILEAEGEEAEKVAKFIRHALACRERRRIAFETQVKKYKFRHIMPIGALEEYRKMGFHRPDEWTRIYKGNPVPLETQAKHIQHIIGLLKDEKYKNYELGLLVGEEAESNLYNHFIWEIKGGNTVVLKDLTLGEMDVIIRDTGYVADFCKYFDWLWDSEDVIKDKKQVKTLLEKHIESLVKSTVIS